jgi:hypothetical protein
MKIRSSITWIGIAALVVASLAIASPAEAQRRSAMQLGPKCAGGVGALFDEIEPVDLNEDDETAVLSMWEEEKLARDVYLALAEIWQLPIFRNIASSEQKHMDLVWKLIETYGISNSFTDDTPGVFVDDAVAYLYGDFVTRGGVSLIEALLVGVEIEDMDLRDLYLILEDTDNDHLQLVFNNLAKGSRNHLRAFMRALEAQGGTYVPGAYLDEDTFNSILEADMEQRMFYNADGEVIPACGAAVGGFGMRRGFRGQGDGGQGNGSGSGTGECDGSGGATGECDGTGPHGGTNGGNGSGNGSGN